LGRRRADPSVENGRHRFDPETEPEAETRTGTRNRNQHLEPAPGTLNPEPQFGAALTPMLAQAILEKAMLEGMTFRASELTDAFVGGGWVWLAVALALFFIYKRVRR
jgi:hypothetical protein